MLILGVVVTAILFVIGAPIYIAFALGGVIILLLFAGFPLPELAVFYFDTIDSFILLAGALFVLAGNLMVRGGMGEPLVKFLSSFTARVPGGLAVATIIVCTFLGALTGSVVATLAAAGIIMFPAMIAANYDRGYSTGVLCTGSTLGTLIPPSVTLILFGFLTQTSVGQLFMAGVVPGLLLAVLLAITAMVIARRKRFPLTPGVSWRERGNLFIKALPGIFMPVIVLGGIYGGVFTPTEAAAVACVYCILVGIFIYRGLNWKNFWTSVKDTVGVVGLILMLIAGGMFLGKGFMLAGFPEAICSWVVTTGLSPLMFLFLLTLAYIGLGFVMDANAIMFVFIPLILPAAIALDINLIHLGIIFLFGVLVGGITPPVAVLLYLTSGMFETPVEDVMKGVIPFLAVMVIVMIIITLFPEISLLLPGTM